MIYEANKLFTKVITSPPFAIQKAVICSPDLQSGETKEVNTALFKILPIKREFTISMDVELKKVIIKPPRLTLTSIYPLKVDEDTKDSGWKVNDDDVKYTYNTYESLIWFNFKIGNESITGEDGILMTTKDRVAIYDLNDTDKNGYYVRAGSKISYELFLVDVMGIRFAKTYGMQFSSLPAKNTSSNYGVLGDDYWFGQAGKKLLVVGGISTNAAPYFLNLMDKLYPTESSLLQTTVVSEKDLQTTNNNPIMEKNFGYNVFVCLMGIILSNRLCSLLKER